VLTSNHKPITVLLADDDPDDRMLAEEAMLESGLPINLHCVADGEQAMAFLHRTGEWAEPPAPTPTLILIDLNMPRKGGHETIREIKADPALRRIPVVVLTTSRADEDVCRSYELGVNSFITKPVTFDALVEVMRTLGKYWFEVVALPGESAGN
jgi:CheY-like chemotaxis protein